MLSDPVPTVSACLVLTRRFALYFLIFRREYPKRNVWFFLLKDPQDAEVAKMLIEDPELFQKTARSVGRGGAMHWCYDGTGIFTCQLCMGPPVQTLDRDIRSQW